MPAFTRRAAAADVGSPKNGDVKHAAEPLRVDGIQDVGRAREDLEARHIRGCAASAPLALLPLPLILSAAAATAAG